MVATYPEEIAVATRNLPSANDYAPRETRLTCANAHTLQSYIVFAGTTEAMGRICGGSSNGPGARLRATLPFLQAVALQCE